MRRIIKIEEPAIVLAFGKIACDAVHQIKDESCKWVLIEGPHPASRSASTVELLQIMAEQYRRLSNQLKMGG